MRKSTKRRILFFIIILILLAGGCKAPKKPEGPQAPQESLPQIPDSISQGEGKEPRLTVHIVEEEENKEMDFEEYLLGVLAGEMQNDWPIEALKAQAILARTFVMEFVESKGGSKYEGAHVSTDIEEAQAWNGEEINDRIKEAVKATRGQVVLHDGNYIRAWFHSHAGGQTAMAVEGLGLEEENLPYIHSVESVESEEAPAEDVNWKDSFSKEEVAEAVEKTAGQKPGDFTNIEVAEWGPSGRAYKLKIGQIELKAPAFRLALDSTRMKSTKLEDILVEGDQVTFEGIGYGHGVGMSQWGAYQMAKEDKKAQEIINHYFKDVKIEKLWE